MSKSNLTMSSRNSTDALCFMEEINISNKDMGKLWCWDIECPDYGNTGEGNIVFKEAYGNYPKSLFKFTTCGHCFSETYGTTFFGLKASREEVIRTLAILPEKEAFEVLPEHQVILQTR